ncbi:hypothetical protein [Actinacidiphila guanduensis]|uniref:Acetyltransferase n=1 Tax=Actinacidiphila guanduensis TaxID=310781 RepID=A0A1H0D8W6_9ACTN|nr:hypothetical protein [Actinacidiphila guanduensis]SDN66396.1 hypothetical protein SAMN05216259_105112 [Actinacidiphila guanduensis]
MTAPNSAPRLVEESHPKVRATYERWGYRTVGRLHPAPDAPHYQAMVLPLHQHP